MQTLLQDIRYGARLLLKKPGFTLIAIITLALGIGATTAIFSVVNAVLLRSLPFRDAERLVVMSTQLQNGGMDSFSLADLEDIKAQAQSFEAITGEITQSVNLTGTAQPERVRGGYVTAAYFDAFKIAPLIGRTFTPEEGKQGSEKVVVVKESFWRRKLNSDPNLATKTLTLNAEPYTVIGVVPNTFRSPQDAEVEVWITANNFQGNTSARDFRLLFGIGYLKPGVTISQANSELRMIYDRLVQAYPKENAGRSVKAELLHEFSVRGIRRALLMTSVAVGFILLISCANLANLMLSRATGRMREMTVRAALGASRGRLMRQLLTESLLLSLTGGVLGLLLAMWSIEPLLRLSPGIIQYGTVNLDQRVVLFTFAIAVLTGVLSGLAPALQLGNVDLVSSMKEGGRTTGESTNWRWARGTFVVVQIALSFTLLIGAGLLIRSFYNLLQIDRGYDPQNLLTLEYRLPLNKYKTSEAQWNFHRQVVENVSHVPGVQSAAIVRAAPHSFNGGFASIVLPDRERPPQGKEPRVQLNTIAPTYLATLKIPLIRGRNFNEGDKGDSPLVFLINQTMANRFWPNEDPIGKQVQIVGNNTPGTVIGIVGDTKNRMITDVQDLQMYASYSQMPGVFATIIARTNVEPLSIANTVREAVWKIDPDQPMWKIRTVEYMFQATIGNQRFILTLMGIFAALALTLAAIGLYGVMSYSVTQRTHEIGIRMALGAMPGDVLKLALKQGMTLALIGVAIGFGVAFLLTRLMATLLYEVKPSDPLTFAGIAVVLTSIALLACWIPARRATKVDPLVALRYE
ncbi:MAG TPA: ABC transporter permease [Blastocatellia bacterium]|nr:ABC transporter permease [Blastocatellia bacterium]